MVARTKVSGEFVRAMILAKWRTMSDRALSEILKVSNATVSKHRNALESEGKLLPRIKTTQSSQACLYEVFTVCIDAIEPCPLNDQLYDPINEADSSFQTLVESIREHGIREPLVSSSDGYILSGHRRHAAARANGMERIPVRIDWEVSYHKSPDEFMRLLPVYNRQRVKTTSDQLREEVVMMSDKAVSNVRSARRNAAVITSDVVKLRKRRRRSEIRDKLELREAIVKVVRDETANWPISDRNVHYRLLNIPGLVRNDKTKIRYRNDNESYNDVTNMLTRLRLDGSVPFEAIADETRPVVTWETHRCVGDFVRKQCNSFLGGFRRNLLQSQANWIELLVEKNTVASQLKSVAAKYTLPMTSGRGYSSLPPRKEMVDRFLDSGREKLVVLVVSDFDPEGEDIPSSFGVSLRDDFRIPPEKLQVVKAALTADQVATMNLPDGQISEKVMGSRYKQFVAAHGKRVWELEALTSDELRKIVEAAIRGVLDLKAFDTEVEHEEREKKELEEKRKRFRHVLLSDQMERRQPPTNEQN